MSFEVRVHIAYAHPYEEYFNTLEEVRDFLKNMSPSTYDWNWGNVRVTEIAREIDVYDLLKDKDSG